MAKAKMIILWSRWVRFMINYLYVLLLAEEKYYVGIAEDIGLIPFQWKMRIFVEKK